MSNDPMGVQAQQDTVVHLASLETRVGALENGVSTIISTLNSLASKVEERGRVQWPAIGVGVALLGLMGGFAYWPIKETLSDMKQVIHDRDIELRAKIDYLDRTTLSKSESEIFAKLRDEQIADVKKRLERLESR